MNDRWIQDTDKGVQRQAMAEAFASPEVIQPNERMKCSS